jgi:hypothetical protein
LYKGKNPYWDWDGILATREEMETLDANDGIPKKDKLQSMKKAMVSDIMPLPAEGEEMPEDMPVQEYRKQDKEASFESYLFNYFDQPRKPYIFATVLNNEDRPIGITSFIEQATSLQEVVDRLVYQIYLNTEVVNGITKVDSQETNLSKADAQVMRYDAGGVLLRALCVNSVKGYRPLFSMLYRIIATRSTTSWQRLPLSVVSVKGKRQKLVAWHLLNNLSCV